MTTKLLSAARIAALRPNELQDVVNAAAFIEVLDALEEAMTRIKELTVLVSTLEEDDERRLAIVSSRSALREAEAKR